MSLQVFPLTVAADLPGLDLKKKGGKTCRGQYCYASTLCRQCIIKINPSGSWEDPANGKCEENPPPTSRSVQIHVHVYKNVLKLLK